MITRDGSDDALQTSKKAVKQFVYLDTVYLGSSGRLNKAATYRAHTMANFL